MNGNSLCAIWTNHRESDSSQNYHYIYRLILLHHMQSSIFFAVLSFVLPFLKIIWESPYLISWFKWPMVQNPSSTFAHTTHTLKCVLNLEHVCIYTSQMIFCLNESNFNSGKKYCEWIWMWCLERCEWNGIYKICKPYANI